MSWIIRESLFDYMNQYIKRCFLWLVKEVFPCIVCSLILMLINLPYVIMSDVHINLDHVVVNGQPMSLWRWDVFPIYVPFAFDPWVRLLIPSLVNHRCLPFTFSPSTSPLPLIMRWMDDIEYLDAIRGQGSLSKNLVPQYCVLEKKVGHTEEQRLWWMYFIHFSRDPNWYQLQVIPFMSILNAFGYILFLCSWTILHLAIKNIVRKCTRWRLLVSGKNQCYYAVFMRKRCTRDFDRF